LTGQKPVFEIVVSPLRGAERITVHEDIEESSTNSGAGR
jgi:hypothetical protein